MITRNIYLTFIWAFILGITMLSFAQSVLAAKSVTVVEGGRFPAIESMKPDQIYFARRFVRFEDWAKVDTETAKLLSLFEGYREPTVKTILPNGTMANREEKLTVYVARAQFLIEKPANQINAEQLIALDYLRSIDPTIQHEQIDSNRLINYRNANQAHNNPKNFRWCEGRSKSLCIGSTFPYPAPVAMGVQAYNWMTSSKKDPFSAMQSELRALSAGEIEGSPLLRKSGVGNGRFIGGIEHNVFYINQMFQFGKTVAIFQQHPTDPNRSIVTAHFALAVESKWFDIKKTDPTKAAILSTLHLLPADFLSGQSVLNSRPPDESITAGLPAYTQGIARRIAEHLERR